jgi:hypothetical protein
VYVPNCDAYRSSLSLKIHPATFWTPHTAKQRISLRISCQRAPSFIPLRDGSVTDFLTPPAPIQGLCHAAGTRPVERPPLRPWRCWGRSLPLFPPDARKRLHRLDRGERRSARKPREQVGSRGLASSRPNDTLDASLEETRGRTIPARPVRRACRSVPKPC